MLGVFLAPALGGTGYNEGYGMGSMISAQFVGVAAVAAWSAIATGVLALLASLLFPMRVSEEEEREGLDITSHGERGWEFD